MTPISLSPESTDMLKQTDVQTNKRVALLLIFQIAGQSTDAPTAHGRVSMCETSAPARL